MIKSELMGRLAHFETRMENLLHERLSTTEEPIRAAERTRPVLATGI